MVLISRSHRKADLRGGTPSPVVKIGSASSAWRNTHLSPSQGHCFKQQRLRILIVASCPFCGGNGGANGIKQTSGQPFWSLADEELTWFYRFLTDCTRGQRSESWAENGVICAQNPSAVQMMFDFWPTQAPDIWIHVNTCVLRFARVPAAVSGRRSSGWNSNSAPNCVLPHGVNR